MSSRLTTILGTCKYRVFQIKVYKVVLLWWGYRFVFLLIKSVWKWMFLYTWPLYDLFCPFLCHMYVHLSQNWGSDNHFEVLNRSYLWLVEKLWRKTQIFPFLFFLRFCTKTDICIFFVFYVFVFFVITFQPIINKTC